MNFDTAVNVISLILLVICYVGYKWCCNNVYLKYKDQKVGK